MKTQGRFKIIIGYDGADVPTKYYVKGKEVTKINFAKEVVKWNELKHD